MTLDLTQDDIDLGTRKNSRCCPFARAFPDADDINVYLYDVTVRHGAVVTKYSWNDADFCLVLDGYDAGHKFLSPGCFDFTQIDEYTIHA